MRLEMWIVDMMGIIEMINVKFGIGMVEVDK